MEQNLDSPVPLETSTGSVSPTVNPSPTPEKSRLIIPLLIFLVVAICLGIILYFLFPKSSPITPPADLIPSPTPIFESLFLNLTSPESDTSVVNGEILISGQTLKNTTVVAYTEIDDVVLDADGQGNFEGSVLIGDNGGILIITAYSDTGEEITQTYSILPQPISLNTDTKEPVFATALLTKTDQEPKTNSNQNKSSPPGQTIKTQVQTQTNNSGDLDQIKVKAFVSAKTVVTKTQKLGADKLKSLLATSSAEIKHKPDKTATFSGDLKLKPMQAKIATGGAILKRHAIAGVITDLSEGVITLTHQIQNDRLTTIYTNAATIVSAKGNTATTSTNLAIGMRIAAVGEPTGNALLATRIHIIPGKAVGVFTKNPVATQSATVATPSASPFISPTTIASPSATLAPPSPTSFAF